MSRMLRARSARMRQLGHRDDGMAMVLVIGSMMIVMAMAMATLAYAMQSQGLARRSQDWNTALAAAQAGVDDYISYLNRSDDYARVWDCTNVAQRGPLAKDVNGAAPCGYTGATALGWQQIAGGVSSQFHYDVDASMLNQTGTVRVVSTGRSKGITRTLDVAVGRGGSTDFLYYTTYEHADPGNRLVYASTPKSEWCSGVNSAGEDVRDIYWWNAKRNGYNRSNSGCTEIQFASGDVLDGRVHVNDTPLIGGSATFKQGLETSDPACKSAVATNPRTFSSCQRGSGSPTYDKPPKWSEELYLDDNSAKFSTYPGCQYTGPTRIVLNADGSMQVWSPWSKGAAAVGVECGGAAVATAGGAANVTVPDGKVIYSRNGGVSRQCLDGEIGDGLPLAGDTTMALNDQFCDKGNIYLEGTLKGRVSIAAANSIMLTGDVLLDGGLNGIDMLGLVAGNSVQAFHPWETVNTTCKRYDFTRSQSVQLVNRGSDSPRSGWVDGYFDNVTNPTSWTPGSWTTKSTTTQQYGGGTGVSGSVGSWSTQAATRRWVPGSYSWNGSKMAWTAGRWVTGTAKQYYQGEQWTRGACAVWNTSTDESTGWPHRSGRAKDLQVFASIQTLQHSFFVQNYNDGNPQGKLTVWGSIAQKWRGIVGTGSGATGYLKDYRYDARLKYSSPPYFPQWSNSKWGPRYTGEAQPRYRGTT